MAYAFNDDKSKFDLDTLAGNMATIEVSPAVSNHNTGEYILYDDILYEVISPIASGESLVLGTNLKAINIGDQLKALRDSMSLKYVEVSKNINQPGSVGAGTYVEIAIPAKSGYTPISINIFGRHVAGYSYSLNWDQADTSRFFVTITQSVSGPPTPTTVYATITYAPIGSPLAAIAF